MNYVITIKKLQKAINMKGFHLLYCTSEFYSKDLKRPVTIYYIKNALLDEAGHSAEVLFRTASQLRVVFFLRDIFEMVPTGKDISEMSAIANEKQKGYKTKHDYQTGD